MKKEQTFYFNCSKSTLISELDKLKVVNVTDLDRENLVCQRVNNKVKLMIYAEYNGQNIIPQWQVFDQYSFHGEISETETGSIISGKFKLASYMYFLLAFGFIISLMFPIFTLMDGFSMMTVGLSLVPVVFIFNLIASTNSDAKGIVKEIDRFREKISAQS